MIIVPNEYCGVAFDVWLDVFLEYALLIAQGGDIEMAYEIIASAFHANVFYHSIGSLFLIHVCWFCEFDHERNDFPVPSLIGT